MRIVACANGLRGLRGHYFNLALGLRAETRARGIDLDLLAHTSLPLALAERLQARPIFHYTHYEELRGGRDGLGLPDLEKIGGQFAADLEAADIGDPDLLFVPTARTNELYGIGEWLARAHPARPPVVALNFMVGDFRTEVRILAPAWSADVYRVAFERLFQAIPRERVCLSSSSAEIAAAVGAIAEMDVPVYPMPKFIPDPEGVVRPPNPAPVIGVLGDFNADRRAVLLPQIARMAASANLACRFLVQGPGRMVRTDLAGVFLSLREEPNVHMINTELDFDGYFSALFACDIVMLPYGRAQYAAMTSGIFTEALAFGKIVIVPDGTWMAGMLAAGHGAGVAFPALNAEALFAAIEQVLGAYGTLAEQAARRAPAWRKTNGLGAFLDRLLADVAAR